MASLQHRARQARVLVLLLTVSIMGCAESRVRPSATQDAASEGEMTRFIALPLVETSGKSGLVELLAKRRSVREYGQEPVSLQEVGLLLWAAQGITHAGGKRTAPSAGALFPLDLLLVASRVDGLAPGVYAYRIHEQQLTPRLPGDCSGTLAAAALEQYAVAHAAATIVILGNYERTARKYGERAERYVAMEAGHVAQNILLQATELDLGAVPVGAFDDARVKQVLGTHSAPLYLIPVGRKIDVP